MKMMLLSALSLLAVGCGTSLRFVPTGSGHASVRAVKAAYQVEVLSLPPVRPYSELGMIEGQKQFWSLDSREAVLTKMRGQAARLGCDALVVTGGLVGFGGIGTVALTGEYGGQSNGYRGTCIVWKHPLAPSAAR